jgi:hypothetical protein
MIIFDLLLLEGEGPHGLLACEVMAVGMFAPSPIRTGVWHLVDEVTVVTGYATPPRGLCGTQKVRHLAVGRNVVEPRAVGTVVAFFVLILH